MQSFDKIKLKIADEDFDLVWSVMDTINRGYIIFNDFCLLQAKASQDNKIENNALIIQENLKK